MGRAGTSIDDHASAIILDDTAVYQSLMVSEQVILLKQVHIVIIDCSIREDRRPVGYRIFLAFARVIDGATPYPRGVQHIKA